MYTTFIFPHWINYDIDPIDGVLINSIRNIIGFLIVDGYKDHTHNSKEGKLLNKYTAILDKNHGF